MSTSLEQWWFTKCKEQSNWWKDSQSPGWQQNSKEEAGSCVYCSDLKPWQADQTHPSASLKMWRDILIANFAAWSRSNDHALGIIKELHHTACIVTSPGLRVCFGHRQLLKKTKKEEEGEKDKKEGLNKHPTCKKKMALRNTLPVKRRRP